VELLRAQANPEQVLAKVVERVIADPHDGTLLEELWRDPRFGAVAGIAANSGSNQPRDRRGK
jgi:hypothetical protein